MHNRSFILLFFLFSVTLVYAQPTNDECQNAILLPISSNWCSSAGQYTNVSATASTFAAPACWGSVGNDVWFSFVAIGTDLNLTINGNQTPSPGGTLAQPQVVLYSGDCLGTINELRCDVPVSGNIVDLYRGGLVIGETYLIRVQGGNNNTGTFQICAQNFNAPAFPGSDCNTASVLCDNSSFVIQSVSGAGLDPDEAFNSCIGGLGGNSEFNSSWFKWTCDQAGTLVFTLSPNNPTDDLDFVVYELPNGINDCSGKIVLRCMAAGDFVSAFPSPCLGPTGLNFTATDFIETSGCAMGQDSWLAALNMTAGTSYAILVNNFTSTGNGFQVEFGGTGTFEGPSADIDYVIPTTNCLGEAWSFIDSSSFSFGSIVDWSWNFGTNANPGTSTNQGPLTVVYNSSGQKNISLTVTSDEGCLVTETITVEIPDSVDIQFVVDSATCSDLAGGQIVPLITGGTYAYQYLWSDTQQDSIADNLTKGSYTLTVTDANNCTQTKSVNVPGPLFPTVDPFFNGIPGDTAITIVVNSTIDIDGGNSSEPNVNYLWTNSPFNGITYDDSTGFSTFLTANVSGLYTLLLTATSSDGCIDTSSIILNIKPDFLGIPDAFSPNNDNVNDSFAPVGLTSDDIKTFKIFNRWGQMVYDGSDSQNPLWDGNYNGVGQPSEVYLYLITYQLSDNSEEVVLRGEVTLLR